MAGTPPPPTQEPDDPSTPDEIMDAAYRELQDSLAEELLQSVRNISSARFEQLAMDLFERMGYGQGETTGRSGDGGVDGIIYQDPLRLERVYIQAKRYTANQVGSPEIRDFIGSLDTRSAHKGWEEYASMDKTTKVLTAVVIAGLITTEAGCTYSNSGLVNEDCRALATTSSGLGLLICQFMNIF